MMEVVEKYPSNEIILNLKVDEIPDFMCPCCGDLLRKITREFVIHGEVDISTPNMPGYKCTSRKCFELVGLKEGEEDSGSFECLSNEGLLEFFAKAHDVFVQCGDTEMAMCCQNAIEAEIKIIEART